MEYWRARESNSEILNRWGTRGEGALDVTPELILYVSSLICQIYQNHWVLPATRICLHPLSWKLRSYSPCFLNGFSTIARPCMRPPARELPTKLQESTWGIAPPFAFRSKKFSWRIFQHSSKTSTCLTHFLSISSCSDTKGVMFDKKGWLILNQQLFSGLRSINFNNKIELTI